MIKFENTEVFGWGSAIRGMRNPMNSWHLGDTDWFDVTDDRAVESDHWLDSVNDEVLVLGEKDLDLMKRLRKAGTDHRKYLRMITVYVDITAPLYWWKEADTYRVGVEKNSCSTMHKIHAKEFTLDDFSHEHLQDDWEDDDSLVEYNCEYQNTPQDVIEWVIECLNHYRKKFIETKDKKYWWYMIQLLPSSYNQKRTVMLNYEVLNNIYKSRKSHKLDEWSVGFMDWIKTLPYVNELIIGEE